MTWKNTQESVTKCERCGRFVSSEDCFYVKDTDDDEAYLLPICEPCFIKENDQEAA